MRCDPVISIGFEVSFGIVAYGHLAIGTHAFGDTMLLLANKQGCNWIPERSIIFKGYNEKII